MNAAIPYQYITVILPDNQDKKVTIRSTRLLHASHLFQGKSPTQVASIVPRLFTLCGNAHGVATDLCLGRMEEDEQMPFAQARVLAENLREHLLRIFLTWPAVLSEAVDISLVSRTISLSNTLLAAGQYAPGTVMKTQVPHPVLGDLVRLVTDEILGMSPVAFMETPPPKLEIWLASGKTLPARFISHIIEMELPEPPDMPALSRSDLSAIVECLDATDADGFIARPELQDGCRATGTVCPLPHPLIEACPTRAAAPFLERLLCICRILRDLMRIASGQPLDHSPIWQVDGQACVLTSRGLLIHHARLDDSGLVKAYHILAPTEWNFHPRGIAARWLSALPQRDMHRRRIASLIVQAVDPCVAFEITMPDNTAEIAANA